MTRFQRFLRSACLLLGGCAIATMLAVSSSANPPEIPARFFALGELAGGATISYAYGISRTGDVIAGESFSEASLVHGEGVHWERTSATSWQMTGTSVPDGALNTPASGVSSDGEWIVGRASFAVPAPIDTDAFRWRPSTGFQWLGLPTGYVLAAALGADRHGNLIVGYGGPNPNYTDIRALAWKRARGGWQIETIEADYDSMATRIDPNGKIALGWASSPAAGTLREAVYWNRKANGTWKRHWLGALPTTVFNSQAAGMATRGSKRVFVGYSGDFFDVTLPVIWTVSRHDVVEMAELPLLPGFTSGSANAISRRALRIVGNCWDADFNFVACIWDWDDDSDSYAVSNLQDRLNELGVTEADGWFFWSAAGLSRDGVVICGSGTNPDGNDEAWAAELPLDSDDDGGDDDEEDGDG